MDSPDRQPAGDLVRTGRVSSVKGDKHTAQVEFFEGDGLISYDLPVIVTCPGDYGLPPVGALAVCLMLPGAMGQGFVIGCIYSESDAPPQDDAAVRVIAGSDVRLGDETAEDAVALAPAVGSNNDALGNHFAAIENVITGAPINEAGNGAPSAFQAALAVAIGLAPYPTLEDTAATKVKAK